MAPHTGPVGLSDDTPGTAAPLVALRDQVVSYIRRSLMASATAPADVICSVEEDWPTVTIRIVMPTPVDEATRRALGVRALDALRSSDRTYGNVDVVVSTATEVSAARAPDHLRPAGPFGVPRGHSGSGAEVTVQT
jgi:hypothetical protein